MGLDLEYNEGQTPLDADEKDGLLIPTISTRGELDEFEQLNIEEALQWTLGAVKTDLIFTEEFIRSVHKRMYSNVWAWAGDFRKTNKDIGIDKLLIPVQLRSLLDDVRYWIEHKTFSPDEITIRFKHKLVSIHCFANGNGRHSRLMADIIIDKIFGLPVFTWGANNLSKESDIRIEYILALREADKGNIEPLLKFARS